MLVVSSCLLCGRAGGSLCSDCDRQLEPAAHLPAVAWVDGCVAALDYRSCRSLLTALKNGDRRDVLAQLADRVAGRWAPPAGAVVTWAPTSTARRRTRGFDQAELLARGVARRWGCPCRALLRRVPGPAQAGRSAADRRTNPGFTARSRMPAMVVVVDDVMTTGATLSAAARALRAQGATTVLAVVAAHADGVR